MKLKHALVGAAVVALTALTGPALASGNTYTVSVGGSTANAASPLSAATTSTVSWAWQRSAPYSSNLNMNCGSSNLTGTGSVVNGGTSGGTSPTNIATLPAINVNTCLGPGGAFVVTQLGPVQLHATSTATSGSSDVIAGHLEGLDLRWTTGVCEFRMSGSASFSFNEATQQLTINETGFTGNLNYRLVRGCLGQFPASGKANFSTTYQLSSAAINVLP